MADTLTSPYNKTFLFLTLINVSVNTTVVAVYQHCGVQREALTLSFSHQTSMSGFILKNLLP